MFVHAGPQSVKTYEATARHPTLRWCWCRLASWRSRLRRRSSASRTVRRVSCITDLRWPELHAAASKPTPWRAGGGRHNRVVSWTLSSKATQARHAEAHRAGRSFRAYPLNAHNMWDIACLVRLTPNLDMVGVGVKRRGTGHFIADVVSALYAEQLLCRTVFLHFGTQFFPWLRVADPLPETSRFLPSCLQTGSRLQTSPDPH